MTAISFNVTLVSNGTDTNPQLASLTLWCDGGIKYSKILPATDSSVQSAFIEFQKLLDAFKAEKGVV